MDRRPNLIAPVLVVACAMIVVGGIMTVLTGGPDSSATAALPLLRQGGTAHPTTGAMPGAGAGSLAATAPTGAGGALDAPEANATVSPPTEATLNGTACGAAGHGTSTGTPPLTPGDGTGSAMLAPSR